MQVKGSTAFVTGANRGIGKAFVEGLLAGGAKKVYAGARKPESVTVKGAVPVKLDITDADGVAAAAKACGDVDLLINNAGIATASALIGAPNIADARAMMETNYFGTLNMCRAFAPVLKSNGGGALVNILSIASWGTSALIGGYSGSKTAELALTRAVRIELRAQGTLVIGVYAGFVDTDMAKPFDVPKVSPQSIVAAVLAGIESGTEDVLADDRAREVATNFVRESKIREQLNQQAWDQGGFSRK